LCTSAVFILIYFVKTIFTNRESDSEYIGKDKNIDFTNYYNFYCKMIRLFTCSFSFCCFIASFLLTSCTTTQNIAYSTISVPEEGGVKFEKITEESDDVITPNTRQSYIGGISIVEWWMNPFIDVSPDGKRIAYISKKNNLLNIMVKNTVSGGISTQRTFRNQVQDLSWSPDGSTICFSEYSNGRNSIYLIDANQGSVVRQITTIGTANDYSGILSNDGKVLYFHRFEGDNNYSIWGYDRENNLVSNYSRGMTPCPIPNEPGAYYCTRYTNKGLCEIWKVNPETGIEEVILSRPDQSFSTPRLSPDGRWLVCTGSSRNNTDIFVVGTDGNGLTQLTYHPGNDLSAVWAPDGKSIYFLSQRGNSAGKYNIWKMDFHLSDSVIF